MTPPPLEGWPPTTPIEQDGKQGYAVKIPYIPPPKVKRFDQFILYLLVFMFFCLTVSMCAGVFLGLPSGSLKTISFTFIFAGIPVYALFFLDQARWELAFFFRRETVTVTFLGRSVYIHNRSYSLDMPHSFEEQPHEKASLDEKDQLKLQMRKKKLIFYYPLSKQIILNHGGQRIVIADIFTISDAAEKIATQLRFVDHSMEKERGQGREPDKQPVTT